VLKTYYTPKGSGLPIGAMAISNVWLGTTAEDQKRFFGAHHAGLQVYFCDPRSPWQRGTNENTNGLLRQYFPKGTDLSIYDADEISAVAAALNARPRKTLGWKTPAEALDQLLSSMKKAGVATTD
jgi:hypothetical protein